MDDLDSLLGELQRGRPIQAPSAGAGKPTVAGSSASASADMDALLKELETPSSSSSASANSSAHAAAPAPNSALAGSVGLAPGSVRTATPKAVVSAAATSVNSASQPSRAPAQLQPVSAQFQHSPQLVCAYCRVKLTGQVSKVRCLSLLLCG